jgi:hypothetical protein
VKSGKKGFSDLYWLRRMHMHEHNRLGRAVAACPGEAIQLARALGRSPKSLRVSTR